MNPAIAHRLLDWLLPPLCLSCQEPVGGNQTLCPVCWKEIHFIAKPYCAGCGAPFEVPVEGEALCGECIAFPPVYETARSAVIYNEASKRLVLSFKHGDRLHPVPALAAWMQRAGEAFWEQAGLIVPVPLHRWRLWKRRYNQAALLALELGRLTGNPVVVDALLRVKATPAQGHLNREARQKNMAKAFQINPKAKDKVVGKIVVLVDDVLTTGATAGACAKVLREAGAAKTLVLTLAKTPGFRA